MGGGKVHRIPLSYHTISYHLSNARRLTFPPIQSSNFRPGDPPVDMENFTGDVFLDLLTEVSNVSHSEAV